VCKRAKRPFRRTVRSPHVCFDDKILMASVGYMVSTVSAQVLGEQEEWQ